MTNEREKQRESLSQQRKAIILVLLSMLLCIAMASATTFAIFTSNINDGKIGVNATSGSVKVDIVNTEGASILAEPLRFVTLDGRDQDSIFFEPGCTIMTEGFRVVNCSSVPANIRTYINIEGDSDVIAFENAFEVWITDTPDNLNYAQRLVSFKDSLVAGGTSDVYYLVIRMKETAGNAYQGISCFGIGITVHAVQGNVEIK